MSARDTVIEPGNEPPFGVIVGVLTVDDDVRLLLARVVAPEDVLLVFDEVTLWFSIWGLANRDTTVSPRKGDDSVVWPPPTVLADTV